MKITYELMNRWPNLAWHAVCDPKYGIVHVKHGPAVETAKDRFFEAAWDGEFESGDFDKTEIVCGTGARLRAEKLVFVSSGHMLDSLVCIEISSALHVSNSLPCILASTDADIDPTYTKYYEDFYAFRVGRSGNRGRLVTSKGDLLFILIDNLEWSRSGWQIQEKSKNYQAFESFDDYSNFLHQSMSKLAQNLRAPERSFGYEMISTTSSGYDSSTVSVIAAQHGCSQTLSFTKTHTGASDSGEILARQLGLDVHHVSGVDWKREPLTEVPFLAANAMGEEVRFQAARELLRGKVLMTGYHGDKVWAKDQKAVASGFLRGDPSGSSLSEFRLAVGFLHCAVPFWGVTEINRIRKISCSPDMQKWSVGGDYDRPICRRIVESAGVSRGAFGIEKKNASQIRHNDRSALSDASMSVYMKWLSRRVPVFLSHGRLPPIPSVLVDKVSFRLRNALVDAARKTPVLWRIESRMKNYGYARRFLFPWAIEHARAAYKTGESP